LLTRSRNIALKTTSLSNLPKDNILLRSIASLIVPMPYRAFEKKINSAKA